MACSVRAANGDHDGCEAAISTEGANHDIIDTVVLKRGFKIMKKITHYYLMAFRTTTDVMQAEECLRDKLSITIMPVPREISVGCGLAIRFMEPDENLICNSCKGLPISGILYKMQTDKVNGRHPIEMIAEF